MSQVLRTAKGDFNLGPSLEFARALREINVLDSAAAKTISALLDYGDDRVLQDVLWQVAVAAQRLLDARRELLTDYCEWLLGQLVKVGGRRG